LAFPPSGGGKGGGLRRKARGFPQSRRQSRFFPDFDATLTRGAASSVALVNPEMMQIIQMVILLQSYCGWGPLPSASL
jgi:hypothetical protein